jgi:hypothetical protein
MPYREELARRYGFTSFAELLEASERISGADKGQAQSYIARRRDGTWFVWEDAPPPPEPQPRDDGSD